MTSSLRALLDDALRLAPSAIPYRLGAALREAFPSRALVETDDADFDVRRFSQDGHCTMEWNEEVHCQRTTGWRRDEPHLTTQGKNAWARVRWEGHGIDVVRADWPEGFNGSHRYWLMADTREVAEGFFSAVCAWCHFPRHELLVFNGGWWSRSHEMWSAVQETSFEDLILAGALKDEIRGDLERFLRARDDYARYRVPWKRGILFVGPPGNGKTHCLREHPPARRPVPLRAEHRDEVRDGGQQHPQCLRSRARADSLLPRLRGSRRMITPKNRSFFLNQLDGFEQNDGILTIATTNHPERLDPAIVDRPSRFDRKYHFGLPARPERHAYVTLWQRRLDASMRGREKEESEVTERLVEETDGFSFAYVKELFVSSMVRWMAGARDGSIAPILFEQMTVLREQMRSDALRPAEPVEEREEEES